MRFFVDDVAIEWNPDAKVGGVAFSNNLAQGQVPQADFWIIDSKVARLYPGVAALKPAWVLEAREQNKSMRSVLDAVDAMQAQQLSRAGTVGIVGGGITLDVGALACSLYKRGVKYFSVPTTVLSQVDSCLGGKTGVNHGEIKNLLGTFYPASTIDVDIGFWKTLPEIELNNGLCEAFKSMWIAGEPGLGIWKECVAEKYSEKLVLASLAVKQALVRADPYDLGVRRALNLGHTVGHGIEAASAYEIPHGFAVLLGMEIEALFAEKMGVATVGCLNEIQKSTEHLWTVARFKMPSWKNIADAMQHDKKSEVQVYGMALPKAPGHTLIKKVMPHEADHLEDAFDEVMRRFNG